MSQFANRHRALLYFSIALALAVCLRVSSPRHALAAAVFVGSQTKAAPNGNEAGSVAGLKIGDQQVVELKRKSSPNPSKPEFTSVTILPGRGMNVFQITANLPGKGEIHVLASPSLEEASHVLSGGPDDVHGVKSFSFGGAFLIPYPNRIRGKLSPDGETLTTEWHGKTLTLPADWKGKKPHAELHAIHGLILDRKTDSLQFRSSPDGETVTGVIHAGDFGGYWLSKTDLTICIALTGKSVEATITAKNVGSEAEPMSIGWHPYFAIPSGDRAQARLHIPASKIAEVNNYDDVFATGNLLPVSGTKYDFSSPAGRPLDEIYMDDNFSDLSRTGEAIVVNLTDPASDYGIHIERDEYWHGHITTQPGCDMEGSPGTLYSWTIISAPLGWRIFGTLATADSEFFLRLLQLKGRPCHVITSLETTPTIGRHRLNSFFRN
jgi:galactose mutarotase-like enzyme